MSRRSFIALDFETTGLSHRQGDRVIEVAALRVTASGIRERYVTLINPGMAVPVPGFISSITGS